MNTPSRQPPRLSPACVTFRDRWLVGLDGPESPPESGHIATCADCQAWLVDARRFAGAVRTLERAPTPQPPVNFASRVAGKVLADRLARRRPRWYLPVSAAAALLLAVGLTLWASGVVRFGEPQRVSVVHHQAKPVPPATKPTAKSTQVVGDTLAGAVAPVVDKAKWTADQTVEGAKWLLAAGPMADVHVEPWNPSIEPAAKALDEARLGAADGLQPVTTSFQRAVNLFSRELTPSTTVSTPR